MSNITEVDINTANAFYELNLIANGIRGTTATAENQRLSHTSLLDLKSSEDT